MSWIEEARCREIGGDFWYPETGDLRGSARGVCERCPVRPECAQYAVDHNERYGVWAGFNLRAERQRVKLRQWLTGGEAVAS